MSLKILLITTSFPVKKESYSGIFVYRLVKNLSNTFSIKVLTPDIACYPKTDFQQSSFTVKTFRYAPKGWQILAHEPGGIPAALHKNRWLYCLLPFFLLSLFINVLKEARGTDVIHANWSVTGCIAGLAGFICRIPVITTVRGTDIKRLESAVIDRLITGLCLKTNQKIVCVSPNLLNRLNALLPGYETKLVVIPNGVEKRLLQINRSFDNRDQKTIRLITIANLIPVKSVDTVIESLPHCPDCYLTIIGDGPLRGELESRSRQLDLHDRTIFKGHVPPEKIEDELSQSDIFILSSKSEGRPNVVLEAMAAGLPVIVSQIEGVTDFIEEGINGLFFSPGDTGWLVECIKRLVNSPELYRKLSENGRNYIIDNELTWENSAGKYAKMYCQLTNRNLEPR